MDTWTKKLDDATNLVLGAAALILAVVGAISIINGQDVGTFDAYGTKTDPTLNKH